MTVRSSQGVDVCRPPGRPVEHGCVRRAENCRNKGLGVFVNDPDKRQPASGMGLRVAVIGAMLWCVGAVPAAAELAPPVNLTPPTSSGKKLVGAKLIASRGTWANSPTSYAYRWQRCNLTGARCVVISGASSSSYILTTSDLDSTIRVRVTAYNAAGHSSARSAPTVAVIASQAPASPAHVMVIVEENGNRSEVIGASNMPYFNSLAAKYGNTTDWNGVSHPSLPNYLALISGSTQGVTTDGCNHSFAGARTIGSQLSAALISWKAYMEEMPEPASEVCTFGGYVKKHNPFAYFPATNGPNVVPATQFQTDLSSDKLPAFMFYVPNLTYDGHDGTNEDVDAYLKGLVPKVLASTWYKASGIIIITWDESNGEEKIPTVVLTGKGGGKVLTAAGDHYGTLAAIEDLYGLPRLEHAVDATSLAPLLK
jgi:phosphatidylinositol-3-phosphatase